MDKVLEEYSEVVDKLKPFVNKPNFAQMVTKHAVGVPKQKVFLIKMELKRLAQPTKKPVDLRGRVDGECKAFEYEGVTHFLDEAAKRVFAEQTMAYGGYTVGVWEEVNNSENTFKQIYKKEKEEILKKQDEPEDKEEEEVVTKKADHLVKSILFSHVISRKEERMNFAIAVEIISEDGKKIKATTMDISVGGMRVKCDEEVTFFKDQKYGVFLRGLETEYALDRKNAIPYQAMRIEKEGWEQRVNFKRDIENSSSTVNNFLQKFIHGYKRRYKINLENTEEAVVSKIYEQYYTPYMESVPVFLGVQKGKLLPKFLLTNNANKNFVDYWVDEAEQVRIESLLSPARIKRAMKQETSEFLVYCFRQVKQNKVFFCSATLDELEATPTLQKSFFALGTKRDSWRVFKVQLSDVHPQQAHAPLTIPESVSEKVKKLNAPPAPRVMADMNTLKFVALITDITTEEGINQYKNVTPAKADVGLVSKLIHPKIVTPSALTIHPYKYVDNRLEQRYFLTEKVRVEWNDGYYDGRTVDISYGGLMVELDEEFQARKGALLKVTLPGLQAMTTKYNLDRLNYQLVNITENGTHLHMRVLDNRDKETKPHHGRQFFNDLIRQNRDVLEAKITEDTSNHSKALRNIFAANIFNMALFYAKDGIHLKHDVMVCGDVPNKIWPLFTHGELERNEFNILPLFGEENVHANWLTRQIRDLKSGESPLQHEVYIGFDPKQEDTNAFKVKADIDFANTEQKTTWLKEIINDPNREFFAIKLFFVKVGKPDPANISAELNYIKVYAPHKAQSLQNHVWQIMSFVDIIDITDEVKVRLEL